MGSSHNSSNFLKKLLPYTLYALFPITLIHIYLNPISFSPTPSTNHITISSSSQEILIKNSVCDYTNGEWVPNKLPPLYNGSSCGTIKQGQNCMLFGRPDSDYLHWKWKPKQCNLQRFDPKTFLNLLKNKHLAYVGDSIARNQLESLLCMMGTSSKSNLYYTDGEEKKFRKWHFPSHNINVSIYWSPFLVKGYEKNAKKNYNTLYLDVIDESWGSDLMYIDILVLSVGHWFLHPAMYYYKNSVLGCHYIENCTEIGFYDVYSKALKTIFQEIIIQRKGSHGNSINVYLTTFSPAHFEGDWDKFGACSKTQPFKGSEKLLEGMDEEMRRIGVEEVKKAKLKGEEFGNSSVRVEVVDITKLALLRPDGHPGPYMNPFPFANGIGELVQNDCVHWCLPGPIDTWNEILLDLLIKRWEVEEYKGGIL
ncbi:hypothetical protein ACJIZ3_010276 [Penstemon smallii]|uniref:Trichome birefringence-like N-terminal domain-containing protein n=1 Tax=Penstemon smallii TaxID=265156 RepID=A0ABD3TGF9_9LAMI